MKKLGRFSKDEILEVEERFFEGQSLYKIGRCMKRSKASIKGHLINLGFIEYEPEPISNEVSFAIFRSTANTVDLIILSFLMIVLPSLSIMYMGFMVLKYP